ncbi:MAG TPA: DNA repair protein RecN [Bacteroidales bacterium]|nr:DNA repair protein RecN [Bacteroidales bacterium]
MIQKLQVENYALISKLDIQFNAGFSTITGETGAGKSILLGALSLLLGQRADAAAIGNNTDNCVVEALFDIKSYNLQAFFEENELDYDDKTVIRRIINTSGKSRAFVNDIPTNLNVLKELGDKLIDIHSQHKNSEIGKTAFQLNALDNFAGITADRELYAGKYRKFADIKKQLRDLQTAADKNKEDYDYLVFRHGKLEAAKLKEGEQEELEKEQTELLHAEDIKLNLSRIFAVISADELNAVGLVSEAKNAAHRIAGFYTKATEMVTRLESVLIEINDLAQETEQLAEQAEYDPQRAEFIKQRLDLLYDLQLQFKVRSVTQLLQIQSELDAQIGIINSYDEQLAALKKALATAEIEVKKAAEKLSKLRASAAPEIEKAVTELLHELGMPDAVFNIQLTAAEGFLPSGADDIAFMFSANKAGVLNPIDKVISGGEMSRVMLSIKSIIAASSALPTIIFDEIDTGVSGDIADKMGNIMRSAGKYLQVISITHLPQVASKGATHYKVYKHNELAGTETKIKQLTTDERVTEIAKMLSGKELTDAAMANAKVLLGS